MSYQAGNANTFPQVTNDPSMNYNVQVYWNQIQSERDAAIHQLDPNIGYEQSISALGMWKLFCFYCSSGVTK